MTFGLKYPFVLNNECSPTDINYSIYLLLVSTSR